MTAVITYTVIVMKRFGLLLVLAVSSFAQSAPKSVYVLGMSGGLDQYLAEWLTRNHVVQVVADPKAADAVLTDSLGESFEQKMSKLHPAAGAKESDDSRPAFHSASPRGTIFLVDANTRQVLWSDFEKAPRTRSASHLNGLARRISEKLQKHYTGK